MQAFNFKSTFLKMEKKRKFLITSKQQNFVNNKIKSDNFCKHFFKSR